MHVYLHYEAQFCGQHCSPMEEHFHSISHPLRLQDLPVRLWTQRSQNPTLTPLSLTSFLVIYVLNFLRLQFSHPLNGANNST